MLYSFLQVLIRAVVGMFFRVEVVGQEHIPAGGCLVVSNHLSWTDTIFIMYALPRRPRIHTMANESTVFNTGFKRWLMPKLAVFPIRRNRGMLDESAVNQVYDLLNAGERVLIFPEGAYGKDGQLRPLKDGVGYFALNSGQPLLPILLTGTGRLRPGKRLTVQIGRPFVPEPPLRLAIKERVQAAVGSVRDAFSRMGHRAPRSSRMPRWFRVRRPGSARNTPQPGGVETDRAVVQGDQPGGDQHDPQQPTTQRPE
ncbi:MAG TPA: lysophospholipid acyltransferase family protein [Candidatus Dormibacteraeota bacterium]|nr:lysophospholipid acyltransferase family protein [Candidatus Dormibacteraeota bacterium]